ncbi:alpha-hydroxy-acid oxidizing protein [Variovorax sp. J31P179]|uniref:alpha-hydroxy-acid oxidizing protein n=1 Tax=Variovorax sp. J31P179 TaxID=3053508 RepID=UPI002577C3F9|nr:alpha-hydroxy-acid oxidizing protein [Variovorax sp. J31P179]MDM0085369.1 alpha-hydroxy-acid oxidizing protein [Variovorax sp. J31P179]
MNLDKMHSIAELRQAARRRLPQMVFDYLDGGAEDERGLARNRAAWSRIGFHPRRLVDVSRVDPGTCILGSKASLPAVVAPTGLNGLLWPLGDVVLARCASSVGIPFVLSSASNQTIEAVAEQAGGDLWFQLYVLTRESSAQLVRRVLAAGYRKLVLTVDVPVNGKRERDLRNGFGLPIRYSPGTLVDGLLHPRWSLGLLRGGTPQLANFVDSVAGSVEKQGALLRRRMDASFDWNSLAWLRDLWPHDLVVKGVLHVVDVQRCFDLGVNGVVLSNHGARQLDDAIAPIEALHAMPKDWKPRLMLDGGVRRGSDIVKAVAAGAGGVMLGRALLYGLAAAGEEGVMRALSLLQEEVRVTMANLGVPSVQALGPENLSWLGRGAAQAGPSRSLALGATSACQTGGVVSCI